MLIKIKRLLGCKRSIEAERRELHRQLNDDRYKSNDAIKMRMMKLDEQLSLINLLFCLLKEDEAFVIQRHIVDGIDWPRVKVEFAEKWGVDFSKTIRTFKNYQRNALGKMEKFIILQKETMGIDYESKLE